MVSKKKRSRDAAEGGGAAPADSALRPFPLRRAALIALLLGVIGLLAYCRTFAAPFIFDDATYITNNLDIRKTWPPWAAYPSRPVLGFTLALNFRWSGFQPWSYHLVSLLIHVLAGWTLFGLARRTLAGEALGPRFGRHATPLALAIALLWLVHPLQTQSVTYIIQRSESLMGLFYLLTMYCAVRARGSPRKVWWWLAALLACALGFGAKQVMVTAPFMVALYYWIFFPGSIRLRSVWLWVFVAVLLAAWAGAIWWMVRASLHPTAGFDVAGVTPWSYAWTQCAVILRYLRLALIPVGLCLDYGWQVAQSISQVWWEVALVSALLALTAVGLVWRSPLGFLGAWFFGILAPTSSFMPLADVAMEHRLYLSLAAVVALVVFAVYSAGIRLPAGTPAADRRQPARCAGWALLLAATLVLTALTLRRNELYRSDLYIWEDTVNKRPDNARALSNYGVALVNLGRLAEARVHLEKALSLKPDYPDARSNLGACFGKMGQFEVAVRELRKAIEVKPRHPDAQRNLSVALMNLGRLDEAIKHSKLALFYNPYYPEAENTWGNCLFKQGLFDEAAKHYRAALQLKPDFAEVYSNLGGISDHKGKPEEAIEYYRKALRIKPDFPEAHSNLASALTKLGQYQEALAHCETALQLNPRFAMAHNNCGEALAALGRLDQALSHYKEAVRQNPQYVEAHYNLGEKALRAGQPELARQHLAEALRLRPGFSAAAMLLREAERQIAQRGPQPKGE